MKQIQEVFDKRDKKTGQLVTALKYVKSYEQDILNIVKQIP